MKLAHADRVVQDTTEQNLSYTFVLVQNVVQKTVYLLISNINSHTTTKNRHFLRQRH